MASRPADRDRSSGHTGWFGWIVTLPFKIVAVVAVSILTSIALEWSGMYFGWWTQPGAAHAHANLDSAIGWIDTQFTRSLIVAQPVRMAGTIVSAAYDAAFVDTGIASWLSAHSAGSGPATTVGAYGQAAVYVTLIILIRVVILVLTSPLFVLAALVGGVDGLVRRDLRRFGAGRESAFIYHHAKRLTGPVFISGWLVYLSIPWSVHPDAFLLPNAALFGLLISIAVGAFKKYL